MIIITGGLGFIGNELARQLIAEGKEITILDNRNRIATRIEDLSGIRVVETDIANKDKVADLFREIKPSTVYHLAAIHYIPECNENPGRTLKVNVEGTQSILDAAAEVGVEKLVFASSGAVYADSPDLLTESSPIAPVDIYGWSKLFGENLCQLNYQMNGIPTVICRLFNNFGPRETNPHIIPEICNQLRSGNRLKLGNITTIRDYIHTSDCAKALIKLADNSDINWDVVNIATGTGFTVKEMIELIGDITGQNINIEMDTSRLRKVDKQAQVASIDHLKKLTGWEPEVDVKEGLLDLLKFEGLI